MPWMLAATLTVMISVINVPQNNKTGVIKHGENVIIENNDNENDTIEEGDQLPDGRIILLLTREDLAYATAVVQSERVCREKLAQCSQNAAKTEAKTSPWWFVAGALILGLVAGGLAGYAL